MVCSMAGIFSRWQAREHASEDPKVDDIKGDLSNFMKKVKWACYCNENGEAAEDVTPVVAIKRIAPTCDQIIAPEVSAWCGLVRNMVLKAAEAGRRKGGSFDSSRLFLWALYAMRKSDWCTMQTTKMVDGL